jgi:hypothetical protein
MISKRLTIPVFCFASLLSQVGLAQDKSAVAAADVLFRQGRQLHDEKRYAEACPKFAESFRLDPATGSLLALASCHEGEGKLASAWAEYNEVSVRARRENQPERVTLARQRASTLEPKLAKLTILLAPGNRAPAIQVQRDSVVLGGGAIGVALPIDRGDHVILASAPGHQTFTTKITIADGATQVVTIPKLASVGALAPAPSPVVVTSGMTEPGTMRAAFADEPTKGPSAFPFKPVGIAAIVGGVAALSAGTASGISALNKNSDSNASGHCHGDVCDPAGTSLRRDAVSAGNLSTGLFVASAVLAGGGIALFVMGGSKDDPKAAKLVPSVGRSVASLSMEGAF